MLTGFWGGGGGETLRGKETFWESALNGLKK